MDHSLEGLKTPLFGQSLPQRSVRHIMEWPPLELLDVFWTRCCAIHGPQAEAETHYVWGYLAARAKAAGTS